MADIPLDDIRPANRPRTTHYWLKMAQGLLLAVLLISGSVAAVREVTAEDRCKSQIGRWAVALKLDYKYSSCQCMKPSLDFSDPCNSMYIPLVLK